MLPTPTTAAAPPPDGGPLLNGLAAALHHRSFAVGSWVQVGDFEQARRVGDSTADFTIVDMEHVGFSFPDLELTLQWLLSRRTAATRPMIATPIVRLPATGAEFSSWMAKQALDHGAYGLLIPQVTAPEQLSAAAAAMRYPAAAGRPPNGGTRGALPPRAMRYWGINDIEEYFARADLWPSAPQGELTLIALLESVTAWESIDEIVRVDGLTAVLWGPGDGSLSLGIRDFNIDHPRLQPHRAELIAACKSAGVPIGTAGTQAPFAAIDEGFDFLAMPSWDEDLANRLRDYASR